MDTNIRMIGGLKNRLFSMPWINGLQSVEGFCDAALNTVDTVRKEREIPKQNK